MACRYRNSGVTRWRTALHSRLTERRGCPGFAAQPHVHSLGLSTLTLPNTVRSAIDLVSLCARTEPHDRKPIVLSSSRRSAASPVTIEPQQASRDLRQAQIPTRWRSGLSSSPPRQPSSISAFGVENIRDLVIINFSGTVTSCAELPPLSVAFWARDGVGRARHV